MTRVLFLCGKARRRSPTAAHVAQCWPQIDADYAGLSDDADEPVTPEHLDGVDIVFVMERRQKNRLKTKIGPIPSGTRVISLDIPDTYEAMDPTLVALLTQKLTFHFGPPHNNTSGVMS